MDRLLIADETKNNRMWKRMQWFSFHSPPNTCRPGKGPFSQTGRCVPFTGGFGQKMTVATKTCRSLLQWTLSRNIMGATDIFLKFIINCIRVGGFWSAGIPKLDVALHLLSSSSITESQIKNPVHWIIVSVEDTRYVAVERRPSAHPHPSNNPGHPGREHLCILSPVSVDRPGKI